MEISIILDNKVAYEKEFKNNLKSLFKNETFIKTLCSASTIAICNTTMVYAKDYSEITRKMQEGFNPLIELLAGLGYPLTYGMLSIGMIMIITGKKSKGLEIMKWAAIGYIGLQFVPFILNLLAQIGRDMRAM